MRARTDALAPVVANCPAAIASQAVRGKVRKAIRTGLWQTVIACAYIFYMQIRHTSAK